MSTKGRGRGQPPNIRDFRSNVAKLKSLGLVSKRVDARSQAPTRYMRSQVRRFEDVLTGKAKVVHPPTRAEARALSDKFTVKGKAVVVPAGENERVRYDKKTHDVYSYRREYGGTITKRKVRVNSAADLPQLKPNQVYTVPIGQGLHSSDNLNDLISFMWPYENAKVHTYKDWWKYVYVETVDTDEREYMVGGIRDGE